MTTQTTARIPENKQARNRLRAAVRDYVRRKNLAPPLSMEALDEHAARLVETVADAADWCAFIKVLLNNAVWRETLANVPFERRLLLLPQCLRDRETCPATLDEIGLLCEACGRCPIGEIQTEAEKLGYVVLVAEGTSVVTQLLARGKVDAVLGVSCLSALERSFPHMAAHAIPGLAIPLIQNGCVNTATDLDWLQEAMRLKTPGGWTGRTDLDAVQQQVASWFDVRTLMRGPRYEDSAAEAIARDWLAKGGHRWRPFLAVCVYKALQGINGEIPDVMRQLAIAAECFHKASLVHDDIEDNDNLRYGDKTLHIRYGVPAALNAGDLLIGEGYRRIADCGAAPEPTLAMVRVAAEGHRTLCLGQGQELATIHDNLRLSSTDVLEIFRRKTAPAFEVALQLGAIYGGAGTDICDILSQFSESLGIVYQIKDDLQDAAEDGGNGRLSLVTALQRESTDNAAEKAAQLLEHHKNQAIRCLAPLRNAHLKGLLRRVVTRIVQAE